MSWPVSKPTENLNEIGVRFWTDSQITIDISPLHHRVTATR
jgi:hypothetical protein